MEIHILRHGLRRETFRYEIPGEPDIVWDVDAARRVIERGGMTQTPVPVLIPRTEMQAIADRNAWDAGRLDHVDPTEPGIAAPLRMGDWIAWVLIDGQHRNARALRDGLDFRAHLLTEQGSRLCLLTEPTLRIP